MSHDAGGEIERYEGAVAVLVSGGPDSAILLAEIASRCPRAIPIYVRFGFGWDDIQELAIRRFVQALNRSNIDPLKVFHLPLGGVYGDHWGFTGLAVPDFDSPDSETDLPARNLFLLVQAAIWSQLNGVKTLGLGLIAGHQFPDKSDAFFRSVEAALNAAVRGDLRIVRPYAALSKIQVLRRGRDWPLQHTWSCLDPKGSSHCGTCNKCAERQRAFSAAGLHDPTSYAD